MAYEGNLVKILLRGLREADTIFFLTQESQKSVVGNIQNQKRPNSMETKSLIFHVGISIVERGSSGEPEIL